MSNEMFVKPQPLQGLHCRKYFKKFSIILRFELYFCIALHVLYVEKKHYSDFISSPENYPQLIR